MRRLKGRKLSQVLESSLRADWAGKDLRSLCLGAVVSPVCISPLPILYLQNDLRPALAPLAWSCLR